MPFPDPALPDSALPAQALTARQPSDGTAWPDAVAEGSTSEVQPRRETPRHESGNGTSANLTGTNLTSANLQGRDGHLAPKTPRVLHLDVDAFLASVEQALHPELRGKPVIVGGLPHERNLVMSCSYEARAAGVRAGMRLAEAARLCPRGVFRRGDSQAAASVRQRIADLLGTLSPRVEIASIDDFFVDLAGTVRALGPAFEAAERVRARILAEVQVPVTIGIATSKSLARIAGKLAKPGGVAEILPGHERAFLRQLPLHHVPGAGGRMGDELLRLGIRTAGDLALVPREMVWSTFGRAGLVLQARAAGLDDEPVEPSHEWTATGERRERTPQSLRRDSTFEPEEGRRDIVEAMLVYLIERAAHRLRSSKLTARSLVVRLQYVDTRTRYGRAGSADDDDPFTHAEARAKLSPPSQRTDELLTRACELLRSLPRRRALVKRVGIELSGLQRSVAQQGLLFDSAEATAQTQVDAVMDKLRARHGFGGVLRGTSFLLAEGREKTGDGFVLRTPSLNQ